MQSVSRVRGISKLVNISMTQLLLRQKRVKRKNVPFFLSFAREHFPFPFAFLILLTTFHFPYELNHVLDLVPERTPGRCKRDPFCSSSCSRNAATAGMVEQHEDGECTGGRWRRRVVRKRREEK